MTNQTGLFVVSVQEAKRAVQARAEDGGQIFHMSAGIATKDDFFNAIRNTLPLDPPLETNRSWDALSDSLWSGLDQLQDERITIVWPDASRMKTADPEAFEIATTILSDLCESLANPDVTAGQTKAVLVLQVINGDDGQMTGSQMTAR